MRIYSDLQQLRDLIDNAREITILVGPFAGGEALVSALALKAIFERSSKIVKVYYQGPLNSEISSLPGGDQIKKELPPKELLISLNLGESAIDKVSYYLEDKTFNLVVKPATGSFDPKDIKFSNKPFESDLIFVLGVKRLEDFGALYTENSLDFIKIPIVNIDSQVGNEQFGQINIIDDEAAGISEIIFTSLGNLKLRPNYEAAQCLLFGLGLLKNNKEGREEEKSSFVSPEITEKEMGV